MNVYNSTRSESQSGIRNNFLYFLFLYCLYFAFLLTIKFLDIPTPCHSWWSFILNFSYSNFCVGSGPWRLMIYQLSTNFIAVMSLQKTVENIFIMLIKISTNIKFYAKQNYILRMNKNIFWHSKLRDFIEKTVIKRTTKELISIWMKINPEVKNMMQVIIVYRKIILYYWYI